MARINKYLVAALLLAFTTVLAVGGWSAEPLPVVGRKIAAKNSKAIVTIEMVVEQSMAYGTESSKYEMKMSAIGTVVDPKGMVVTALSRIDPYSMTGMFDDMDIAVSAKLIDAFIRLEDGTEIEMNVVVRDKDLNLAFLKPKEPIKGDLPYVNLKNSASPPALDEVLTMYRLGQVAGRSIAVKYDNIAAVVSKPRKFFVVSNAQAEGGPAFITDGRAVGIVVTKRNVNRSAASGGSIESLVVVMPSETVLQALEQAKKPAK